MGGAVHALRKSDLMTDRVDRRMVPKRGLEPLQDYSY